MAITGVKTPTIPVGLRGEPTSLEVGPSAAVLGWEPSRDPEKQGGGAMSPVPPHRMRRSHRGRAEQGGLAEKEGTGGESPARRGRPAPPVSPESADASDSPGRGFQRLGQRRREPESPHKARSCSSRQLCSQSVPRKPWLPRTGRDFNLVSHLNTTQTSITHPPLRHLGEEPLPTAFLPPSVSRTLATGSSSDEAGIALPGGVARRHLLHS